MLTANEILQEAHILIGGTTGSGKSVFTNTLLWDLVHDNNNQVILIDNKCTEFKPFKLFDNCIGYCNTAKQAINALDWVCDEITRRADTMQSDLFCREYKGKHLYIFIDELADLLTEVEVKKQVLPKLQRIAQIGRAFRVHLVLGTQTATKATIGTVKNNITCVVALRVATRDDSRVLLGFNGAENISRFGVALVRYKGQLIKHEFNPVNDSEVKNELINRGLL